MAIKIYNKVDLYGKPISQERLDNYAKELAEYEARCEARRPVRDSFSTEEEFIKAHRAWDMDKYMGRPDPPGYYRACND